MKMGVDDQPEPAVTVTGGQLRTEYQEISSQTVHKWILKLNSF